MEVFQEVLRVWDKSKPEKVCLHVIFGHDIKFHSFQGGEATRSKEGRSDCKNVCSKKPSWYSSLQQLSPILPMFCEKLCIHYGTHHKTNAKIERVHLDPKVPRCMGDHKAKICNSNYTKLGERIPCTYECIQYSCRGYAGPKSRQ